MKLKLLMLLALFVTLPALAERTGLRGVVVDAKSGMPVVGATVMLDAQGNTVTTGPSGDYGILSEAQDVIKTIDQKALNDSLLREYYEINSQLWRSMADYVREDPYYTKYITWSNTYLDSVKQISTPLGRLVAENALLVP